MVEEEYESGLSGGIVNFGRDLAEYRLQAIEKMNKFTEKLPYRNWKGE
jgi:hypothetical protein